MAHSGKEVSALSDIVEQERRKCSTRIDLLARLQGGGSRLAEAAGESLGWLLYDLLIIAYLRENHGGGQFRPRNAAATSHTRRTNANGASHISWPAKYNTSPRKVVALETGKQRRVLPKTSLQVLRRQGKSGTCHSRQPRVTILKMKNDDKKRYPAL